MTREQAYLSVIIYTRNDEALIGEFLSRVDGVLCRDFENYDITVVDDASTDRTVRVIEESASMLVGELTVIELAWKHGVERAILAGTEIVVGDFVVEIEQPEFPYPEDIFLRMYREATTGGYDVVSATGSRSSRLSSRLFYRLLNRLSHQDLELETEDLRLITRRAINRITTDQSKVRYRKVLYKYSGFRVGSIRYEETHHPSKRRLAGGDRLRTGVDVLVLFTNFGTKLGGFFSTLFLLLSLGLGIYAFVVYLVRPNIASGWTTLMVFLSLGFSGLFLVMTLLAKYVSIILEEVQQSRSYTVKSIERMVKRGG